MKKSFVLFLVLTLLVSGTIYYAQTEILKEKDQVHFTENIIYGDKSVVDGVTVEMHNMYDYQMFWHSTYEIGEEPKVNTDYEFYPWANYNDEYYTTGALELIPDYGNNSITGEEKNFYGLDAAMKELYDQTQPGEVKTATVFLKDYVDYYTFVLDLQLPQEPGKETKDYYDYMYIWGEDLQEEMDRLESSGSYNEELEKLRRYVKDLEMLQEFFKIPVLEKEAYTLAIAKDSNGNVIGATDSYLGGGSGSGEIDIPEAPSIEGLDHFSLSMRTAFDDGDCYLTFDPYTLNGNVVDTSLIPGGYGLYHFTYDSEKGTIDLSQLKMVYPLDVSTQIETIKFDESGKNLLLFHYENGRLYLSVIDRETMTLIDKFDIASEEYGTSSWSYEDYLVVSSENLMVFTIDENGRYTKRFEVNQEKMEELIDTTECDRDVVGWWSSFDWNGDTLLISSYTWTSYLSTDCGFQVAAVDETGLLYYGEYSSSLATVGENYYHCRPNREVEETVSVRWN